MTILWLCGKPFILSSRWQAMQASCINDPMPVILSHLLVKSWWTTREYFDQQHPECVNHAKRRTNNATARYYEEVDTSVGSMSGSADKC